MLLNAISPAHCESFRTCFRGCSHSFFKRDRRQTPVWPVPGFDLRVEKTTRVTWRAVYGRKQDEGGGKHGGRKWETVFGFFFNKVTVQGKQANESAQFWTREHWKRIKSNRSTEGVCTPTAGNWINQRPVCSRQLCFPSKGNIFKNSTVYV